MPPTSAPWDDATDQPRFRRRRWIVVLSLVLLTPALAALGVRIARARRAAIPRPAAAMRPAPPAPQRETAVTTTGTIRLRTGAEVRVGSQVSGTVSHLYVAVGTHIQKGDVIAEIDPRPLQAKLDVAASQMRMDEVGFEKAQRDLDRGTALFAANLVPRQQAEDLRFAASAAQAKLANSRSQLAAAQLDLSYTTLRAPIAGTVSSVATQEGETVAAAFASPTFITIIQDRALELVALVDETDIGGVRPGAAVSFTVESFPDRVLHARVSRIDPTATIISGVVNYAVVAPLLDLPSFLRPDMTATISIATRSHD
ncbi:MAG TPA: efflux RND transporter periplasmic adaptor subunit [Terriglobales bacterium]|nr:efflux RND transporter periplasmic adaptor subunit [Terriglobales bacterium]